MDKRAKQILFRTHWKNGWIDRSARRIDPADFEYAKSMGLMFDPVATTHDVCVRQIRESLLSVPVEKAARAFLSSLSQRRLDWRSGLASYVIAEQVAAHSYAPAVVGQLLGAGGKVIHTSYSCGACRDCAVEIVGHEAYEAVDLNVLNFERIKWGGIRHDHLEYIWFDLEQLSKSNIPDPTPEDIAILAALLEVIEKSRPTDHPGALVKNLAPVITSTKDERVQLIEILAGAGVLRRRRRDLTVGTRGDWRLVGEWRGEDGYDKSAVEALFGQYL
ncbi:hypothetical protein ABZ826_31035 [Streptomyces sp. NPDC047515]|uniref:hypothetical protein n=1 Tax=Streptomyces sp. NPDC047515 TaxID=3155380 RepID=UPI0033CC22A5